MPPTNPRKRAAPGSSPAVQNNQMPQSYTAPAQVSNADFLRWNQNADNGTYTDPANYNANYAGASMAQPPFDQSIPTASTQLARRPNNRQVVSTQRVPYDNQVDPWGANFDDALLDPQNGMVEENDNIELLEERASVAKRDAQSKRKQIPPFVQKLSR